MYKWHSPGNLKIMWLLFRLARMAGNAPWNDSKLATYSDDRSRFKSLLTSYWTIVTVWMVDANNARYPMYALRQHMAVEVNIDYSSDNINSTATLQHKVAKRCTKKRA